MVADLLRKGTDESTFGPWFAMTGSSVADSGRDGASLRISGAQHVDIMQNNFAKSDGILVIHSVGAPETRIASRSEEHTSELQSLMRNSYAVFCLEKKKKKAQRENKTI